MEERCGATISPQHPLYRNGTTSKEIVMQELTNFVVKKSKFDGRLPPLKIEIAKRSKIFVGSVPHFFLCFIANPTEQKA